VDQESKLNRGMCMDLSAAKGQERKMLLREGGELGLRLMEARVGCVEEAGTGMETEKPICVCVLRLRSPVIWK
jgi:hypothetical protein